MTDVEAQKQIIKDLQHWKELKAKIEVLEKNIYNLAYKGWTEDEEYYQLKRDAGLYVKLEGRTYRLEIPKTENMWEMDCDWEMGCDEAVKMIKLEEVQI